MNQDYLEITYISPVSSHNFCSKSRYFLVFVGTADRTSIVSKIQLENFNRVNKHVRAFVINKTIMLPHINQDYAVRLFKLKDNVLELIFSGNIDFAKSEYNHKIVLQLETPSLVNNKYRNTNYVDDSSFLDEVFYNYETTIGIEKCVVFLLKLRKPRTTVYNPTLIHTDSANQTYVYDRENRCLIKETYPIYTKTILERLDMGGNKKLYHKQFLHTVNFISNFCLNSNSFKRFLDLYQVDTRVYTPSKSNRFVDLLTRRIKMEYRPLMFEPYTNNMVVVPNDCRLRGFHTNPSTTFVLYNYNLPVNRLVSKPYEIFHGSGFLCRMCPQDYTRTYMPYSGYLTEVGLYGEKFIGPVKDLIKKPYIVTMRFESKYFIPPDVHERALLSAMNGNHTYGGVGVGAGSRSCPESLESQPDTKLIFYIVLVGSVYNNSVNLSNTKLQGLKKSIRLGTTTSIKPLWMEQGEEIGFYGCGGGSTLFLLNRKLDFTSDVKRYSQMDIVTNNGERVKQMDTKLKARDIVAAIV